MGKQADQVIRTLSRAGLPAACLVLVPGRSQGVQRMLEILGRVIHQLEKPSIFQSPVLILQFPASTEQVKSTGSWQLTP